MQLNEDDCDMILIDMILILQRYDNNNNNNNNKIGIGWGKNYFSAYAA
jgi:hypothetical protein